MITYWNIYINSIGKIIIEKGVEMESWWWRAEYSCDNTGISSVCYSHPLFQGFKGNTISDEDSPALLTYS